MTDSLCPCGHPKDAANHETLHDGVTLVNILRSWVGYHDDGIDQILSSKANGNGKPSSGPTLTFMLGAAERLLSEATPHT